MRKTSKKGQAVVDVMTIILVLVVFGITAVVMANVIKPIDSALQTDDNIDNFTKGVSSVSTTGFLNATNNIAPMIIVILWIGGLVAAFLIDTHPGFAVLSIVLLIFLVVVAAIMANMYDDATSVLDRTDYGLTNFIFENLVVITLVMASSIIIVLFARLRGGSGV